MKKSGVYIISSIKFPDRIYVGSAVNLKSRECRHFVDLSHNRHHNAILQNHYDKYGRPDLQFLPILYCELSRLLVYEQSLIDSIHPYFNINPIAGSRAGAKHTVQTKLKISQSWRFRPPLPVSARYAKYLPK